MYKTIGILGGMGPAATCDLMQKIIDMTDASCDQDHIPMIIDSNTRIPDRTKAILGCGEDPVPEMLRSAERLEAAGADFLIVPCNTSYYYVPGLAHSIGIPFINMPDETAGYLEKKGVTRAAVLATDGTIRSGLYDDALGRAGIEAIYPYDDQQEQIMSLVYDYIKKGITDPSMFPTSEIGMITDDLKSRGAGAIVLACTELPIAFSIMGLDDGFCVDPTAVLAAAAIREAGGRIRQNPGHI